MVYEKLVRDKIPQMIEAEGRRANYRILDDMEYRRCLERKLDEEVWEYHTEKNLEELVDILEVVFALAQDQGSTREQLLQTWEEKHTRRGGFRDKIFLISTEG